MAAGAGVPLGAADGSRPVPHSSQKRARGSSAAPHDAHETAKAYPQFPHNYNQLACEMMYAWFNEHLNVVSPDVSGDYLLEGLGTLTNLSQGDYKLATDDPQSIQKFTFHWACERQGRHEFKVENPIIAEKHREHLWNQNLRFNKRDLQKGAGAVFVIEAYVPVSFEFESDPVKNVINLKLKNLGTLGTITT